MNESSVRLRVRNRWLVAVLLLLSAVPVLAGVYRLGTLVGAVEASSDSARLLAVGRPLAAHVGATAIFLLVGPFQLAPAFRARHPRAHRAAGLFAAPAGLVAALSGLWLTLTIEPGPYDGRALFWIRVVVGVAMVVELALGLAALPRRQFAAHGAWMIRAYALGLGAGTQVLTHLGMRLAGANPTTDHRTVAMGGAWLINVLIAEWVVRSKLQKQSTQRLPASSGFAPPSDIVREPNGRSRPKPAVGIALVVASLFGGAGMANANAEEAGQAPSIADAPQPPTPGPTPAPPAPAPPSAAPAPSPSSVVPPCPPSSSAKQPGGSPECSKSPKSPGSGILGLRVTYVHSDSPNASDDAVSAAFGGRLEAHNDESAMVAYRGRLDFALGGGSAGIDGLFGGALLVGLRLPVSAHHAPFARLGFAGEIQGNERYHYSRFDLPLVEVGHQYVNDDLLLELGIRFSPVLAGRFRSNSEVRLLSSSFSFGSFATAQLALARFDLLYTRIEASDRSMRAVDTFQGLACILPLKDIALCLDGQLVRTDVTGPSGSSTPLTSGFVGGLLGVGGINGSKQR